ncbi:hypothetical protein OQA88_3861 [Cercophora sp. LCS_1]
MRPTLRHLAQAVSTGAKNPLSASSPMNLLPPIPLYRRLLRAHRKFLPAEMRLLGDEYVKAEFRAHRDVENPVHLVGLFFETNKNRLASSPSGNYTHRKSRVRTGLENG